MILISFESKSEEAEEVTALALTVNLLGCWWKKSGKRFASFYFHVALIDAFGS